MRGLRTQKWVAGKKFGALRGLPAIVAVILVLSWACAPQYRSVPPSPIPAVTINTSQDEVVQCLTDEMVALGFTLASSDSDSLVFEKTDYKILTARVGGSHWHPFPLWRIAFDVGEATHGTRVVGKAHVVTNPGTKYEKITDMAGGIGPSSMQELLEDVKEICETPIHARKTRKAAEAAKRGPPPLRSPAGEGLRDVTYSDGSKYVGEWRDNKMDGRGTYTWPNGVKYIGEFEGNRAVGGWLYRTDGSRIWVYQDSRGNWVTRR